MVKFWNSCISKWEGRLTLHKWGVCRSFMTMTMTIWWPRSGVWIYQRVTGVTSVVGVLSTHLVTSYLYHCWIIISNILSYSLWDCSTGNIQDVYLLSQRRNRRPLRMTFSNAFSWIYWFCLEFHWSLFPRVRLTIFQHWFRLWLGTDQATIHYFNQWWFLYWHIYVSLGLNELITKMYLKMTVIHTSPRLHLLNSVSHGKCKFWMVLWSISVFDIFTITHGIAHRSML